MYQPKVSVIIPMYNCEHYIEKCLASLLSQSLSEYEVIIVNDGSTDGSEKLVKEFIRNNQATHFHLFTKANGGISSARNLGIEQAVGDWLVFVDADDWVEPDFLRSMLEPALNSNADFCISGYTKYFECTGSTKDCYSPQNCFCTREEAIGRIYYPAPFARMYSRRIVIQNHVRFDERIHVGEDRAFNFDYLRYTKTCVMVNARKYVYRIHSSSITHREVAPSKRKHSFESVRKFWLSFSDSSVVEKAFGESRYLSESIFGSLIWDVICSMQEGNKALIDVNHDPVVRYIIENYQPQHSSSQERLFVFLLKHRFNWLMKIVVKLYYDKRLRTIARKLFPSNY